LTHAPFCEIYGRDLLLVIRNPLQTVFSSLLGMLGDLQDHLASISSAPRATPTQDAIVVVLLIKHLNLDHLRVLVELAAGKASV